MQSIPVFPDILKIADFRWKKADLSKTQVVCHVIYVFFGSFLGITVPSFINVQYMWQILERRGLPIREQLRKNLFWIGLSHVRQPV